MVRISSAFCLSLLLMAGAPAFGEEQAATPGPETSKTSSESVAGKTPAGSREQALKTWEFLKENGKDTREEMMETTLLQLNEFLRLNPDWDFSEDARLLKADLHARRGEYKFAVTELLALLYEFPNSKLVFPAKRTLTELIDKKMEKKLKPVLQDASKGSEAKEKSERLAQLLKTLTTQAGEALYEPLVAEYDGFFSRFPSYAGTDELTLLFADLQVKKEKYLAALTYYRKLLALYPESRFRPRAQRSIGDLYVNDLKDINEAENAYQRVINKYPQSEEAGYAYEQTAKLEEQLKHFDLSVEMYEKMIALYPNTDRASRAFNGEVRVLLDQMEKPDEAIKVYGRLADMFKGSTGAADALLAAASTAHKIKNFEREAEFRMRFVNEFGTNKDAPEQFFLAAQVTEEGLASADKAVDLYNQLMLKYPESKYANKAKSRVDSLTKK